MPPTLSPERATAPSTLSRRAVVYAGSDLSTAYIILIVGLSASVLILIIRIIVWQVRNRQRRARQAQGCHCSDGVNYFATQCCSSEPECQCSDSVRLGLRTLELQSRAGPPKVWRESDNAEYERAIDGGPVYGPAPVRAGREAVRFHGNGLASTQPLEGFKSAPPSYDQVTTYEQILRAAGDGDGVPRVTEARAQDLARREQIVKSKQGVRYNYG